MHSYVERVSEIFDSKISNRISPDFVMTTAIHFPSICEIFSVLD